MFLLKYHHAVGNINMATLAKIIACNGAIYNGTHRSRTQLLFLKIKIFLGLTKWDATCNCFLNTWSLLLVSLVCQGHTLLQASMLPTTQFICLSLTYAMWPHYKAKLLFQFIRDNTMHHLEHLLFSTNTNHK